MTIENNKESCLAIKITLFCKHALIWVTLQFPTKAWYTLVEILMIYYFRHFLLYRTFSDIRAMYPIRQNENAMYYIRQVCIISDIACIISDMHVLYPTWMYYIRHACIISDMDILRRKAWWYGYRFFSVTRRLLVTGFL